ncbi:MAG: PAS domain-containing protein, partial [Gammaproteobacteria bacterium]|nr:PAS domain-containing protein [Gammaproteobacteria bacterium]
KPTSNAVKIVPKEVAVALTTGLHRMRKGESELSYAVAIESGEFDIHASIQLSAIPFHNDEARAVVFSLKKLDETAVARLPERIDVDGAEAERLHALESDLRQTKETLQATIEELQTTNEEQQSTNEELIAANEELQSTNEELQSVNEELHTVNVELQRKNEDLSVMTADLDNLLENIEVGTLFLDQNLSVRKFTVAVSDLVNLTPHDIGRSIEDFSHQLATDFIADVRKVIATGQRIDKQVSALGGAWYHMRIVPYHTKLGADAGVLVTFVDVTGTKNMEELARSINQQLEDANRRLSDQTNELEELFSITAHDLKRPIAAIDGLLRLSLRRLDGAAKPEALEQIETALSECARMHRMITDLGQVSGIRESEHLKEEFDLQTWMDGIVNDFREQAIDKGIQLNYSCDRGTVELVRSAPEQALRNIIENAILYGSSSEKPRIDISCQLEKGYLRLTVADNGQGIAPEHQERVFELFRRLDPSVGEGSGVGLVAVRRLVAKAGGTVGLESEPGHGAKFTIKIPVEARGRRGYSSKERILLVEDDTVDAKTAMRHLKDNYDLTWATTLAEAKDMVQAESYDLVLLDLSLPDGHGLELLTEVRRDLHKDVPIVILTGHSGIVEERSLRASTEGYLTKAAAQQQSLLLATVAEAMTARSSDARGADRVN